jgi:hypothetical protein
MEGWRGGGVEGWRGGGMEGWRAPRCDGGAAVVAKNGREDDYADDTGIDPFGRHAQRETAGVVLTVIGRLTTLPLAAEIIGKTETK